MPPRNLSLGRTFSYVSGASEQDLSPSAKAFLLFTGKTGSPRPHSMPFLRALLSHAPSSAPAGMYEKKFNSSSFSMVPFRSMSMIIKRNCSISRHVDTIIQINPDKSLSASSLESAQNEIMVTRKSWKVMLPSLLLSPMKKMVSITGARTESRGSLRTLYISLRVQTPFVSTSTYRNPEGLRIRPRPQ